MDKKKQHYVPRFYLKLFSSKPDRINIYNFHKNLFIEDAGLKDQCYRNKFYGEDNEIENFFGQLEAYNAKAFKDVIQNEHLPIFGSKEFENLLAFLAAQLQRTAKSAKTVNENIDKLTKKVYEEDPKFRELKINEFMIGIKNPIFLSLSLLPLVVYSLNDLALHLVYSGNHRFFITCDSPIAKYNHYIESALDIGKTGLLSRGLQIFYPISPHYLLILYDKDIYHSIGDKSVTHFITDKDLNQLNLLQFIEADENIYFNNWQDKENLQHLAKYSVRFRKKNMIIADKFYEDGENTKTQLVVNYETTPNIHLNLSFLDIKRSVNKISLNKRLNLYRKDLPKEFTEKMNNFPQPDRPIMFSRLKKPII